jgi:hypothetical protein
MTIKNNSGGPRIIAVMAEGDIQKEITLQPGESTDFDVVDTKHPVYLGWQEAGEVDFGGALESADSGSSKSGRRRLTMQDAVPPSDKPADIKP